ncbi:N-acetyl-gamma-glutamyl-phosphate reductase [Myroides sp. 1354]|uniref:N-acetyl-gamma-glutamyl-phosphate reductase n=1 Tax=unclassified Myroides TaxID=2642485 RepID=UPI002577A946|nr:MULTISPECIES: N-acetyl-gamma-glutamyl-phosphate reductase [unclassified Myroides]MDM1043733.1 N-acetyl-gamma-glutamyl-phosphate reductase [Myroides sp. R163-1]MDM1054217.1 N-acetyl-gamma-glutamyl-phosphate reductase [Myroides sp. 1354]MDM1067513.1 N-acetyl-gamma-glutamyl-phosphate reductase [Myroides sp. 1372]
MNKDKIKVGIVGGAGYTGGELLRLLLNHPAVDLVFIHSKSQANKPVYTVHADLFGDTEMLFTAVIQQNIDVVFLCLGHGDSQVFLNENHFDQSIKIIDLSQDFRLKKEGNPFVYGLPELNRDLIKQANYIANPGCFATAIQLALLPLANQQELPKSIYIQAVTGSTGAGQSLANTSHFSWRANNLSVYKAFTHQHLGEIGESLAQLQPNHPAMLKFIPERGDFARGIFASVVMESTLSIEELQALYANFYETHPFTHFSKEGIHLKQVVNTNKCLISIDKNQDDVLITSAIDNLLKGAAGQAVQNMNLLFGLEEKTGLKLKASAF